MLPTSTPSSIADILSASVIAPVDIAALYAKRLEETGLKNTQVAKLIGIERKSLDLIIDGTSKQPSLQNLIKVAEFLGLELNSMIASVLQAQPKGTVNQLNTARKATFITNHFDLPRLKAAGFIKKVDDLEAIEQRICKFFSIPKIEDYENIEAGILFSKTKNPYDNKMIDFWMKSACGYFDMLQSPQPYDRDLLAMLIPKIRGYTRDVATGLPIVIRALYNAGVTVLYQQHLAKTSIRGATILANDKPCIVITDLNKNYATIWFALVHELHHVLYDLDTIRDTTFHLTGEPDLFLIENRANDFARELLFSRDKMIYVFPMINNPTVVQQAAQKHNVHPSIIYSFYQYDQAEEGNNYWGAFKEYFPDVRKLTKQLNAASWSDESIEDSVAKIKEAFQL